MTRSREEQALIELRECIDAVLATYVKDMINDGDYERARKELLDIATAYGRLRLPAVTSHPAGEGWRPIETAPKDGTPFFVWTDGGFRFACYVYGETEDFSRFYVLTDEEDGTAIRDATHWMPLPAPPASVAGQTPEAGK